MKNLLNLEGVKALSKMEQKNVFGGETELTKIGDPIYGCTVTCSNGETISSLASCAQHVQEVMCTGNGYGSPTGCVC